MGVRAREDAHAMGYAAAFYGARKETNPFVPFTPEFGWWNDGYAECIREESGAKVHA